jgi:hypothetical protein
MPHPTLRGDLINAQVAIQRADAMVSAARGMASIPAIPHAPLAALPPLVEALAAQQQAIAKMYKLLEKLAE